MTVIVFIVILLILLISHELGHFIVAKWSGMKVEEFGIGFPPKLFSKKFGETVYSLNAIPFGAFVKILGEDGDQPAGGSEARSSRSFSSKPLIKQALVVVAGVVAHVVLAVGIYWVGYMGGMPELETPQLASQLKDVRLMALRIVPGSPISETAISLGSTLVGLESAGEKIVPTTQEDLVQFIGRHSNDSIVVEYIPASGGNPIRETVVPEFNQEQGRSVVGLGAARVGILELPVGGALVKGAQETWRVTTETIKGYGMLLSQTFRGEATLDSVTGPVGIAKIVGEAWRLGFAHVISLTALLSINLAIINLVPFPALDGGRLLFIIIEKIRRRAISPKVSQAVNGIGFGLLILLMVVITYHDIARMVT